MKIRIIGAAVALVLAITGTLVLVGYVNSADARAAQGAELAQAYVVAAEVPAGTPGDAIGQYIEVRELPAAAIAEGRVTDLSELDGLIAEIALRPGEQLLSSRWIDPRELRVAGAVSVPDGLQAVTIALPIERVVGGSVEAGDTVGVLISADPGGNRPVTRQAFHKVLVVAVQRGTALAPNGSGVAEEAVDTVMVTLAQPTADIETLIWGQQWGTVWLTLEPKGASTDGGRTVDGKAVFG